MENTLENTIATAESNDNVTAEAVIQTADKIDGNDRVYKKEVLEEGITTMTDEQLDMVVKTLEDNKSADDKLIQDIINNEINPDTDLESEIINVSANPETGEINFVTNEEEQVEASPNLQQEDVIEAGTAYNLDEEQAQKMFEIIAKYARREKFDIYEEMPENIKSYVDEIYNEAYPKNNKITKNDVARYFLNEFIKEANDNRSFVDLQNAIDKELQIPSITDMYTEHIKDTMETVILETADKIEAEQPDKAKALRDISAMFTESYTFGLMKSNLINNKAAKNRIRESVIDYPKYCNQFNERNKSIVIKINDVKMMYNTLRKTFKNEFTEEDIKKFVVLFCKTCEGLDNTNISHCAYMYYTIKDIIYLDYAYEAKTEFSKQLIENIRETIKFILNTQAQVEASMPPKLLKSKIRKCNRKTNKK